MRRALSAILLVVACIGTAGSIGMLIMAVRFGELGRVLFYGIMTIVCVELAVFAMIRMRKKNE